jgi:hypothetical protein
MRASFYSLHLWESCMWLLAALGIELTNESGQVRTIKRLDCNAMILSLSVANVLSWSCRWLFLKMSTGYVLQAKPSMHWLHHVCQSRRCFCSGWHSDLQMQSWDE